MLIIQFSWRVFLLFKKVLQTLDSETHAKYIIKGLSKRIIRFALNGFFIITYEEET